MAVEAVGVFMLVGMINKKPASAEAATLHTGEEHKQEAMVELPLLEEHFQNLQTGRVWVWDAELAVRVKKKNEKHVSTVLEDRASEVKEGIATIFRRATFAQLKEPGLESLNRQVLAFLDNTLGKDTVDHETASYIDKVLMPRCRGFPAD
jgi:flagellar basal body-associated protein FliL